MTVVKTYKFKLYKNDKKNKLLYSQIDRFAGVYNHSIALHNRYYSLYKKHLNKFQLMKHLTKIKNRHSSKAYWKTLPSQAIQDVVERIDRSYTLFFSNIKKKRKCSPPGFRKFKNYKSFTLKQAGYKLFEETNQLRIGKHTYGFHRSRDILGQIKTLTIKRNSIGELYLYFVVVNTSDEEDHQTRVETGKIAGFDFGLKTFLTSSDGTEFKSPQYFKHSHKELAVRQRSLSRKKRGSNNRLKAKQHVARIHIKIADQRKDYLMKLARQLCLDFDVICLEDLTLTGMKRIWGRKMSDLSFGVFVGYVKYFSQQLGTKLVLADKFFPSSKTCSDCGVVNIGLQLKDREWACKECGTIHNRDLNAAINLKNYALGTISNANTKNTVGASTVSREDKRLGSNSEQSLLTLESQLL